MTAEQTRPQDAATASSGSSVTAALSAILDSDNDVIRCAAIECLGHLLPGPAEGLLIRSLDDPDVDARILAARALEAGSPGRAGPALSRSVVEDPSGEVKEAAITSIGRLGYCSDTTPLHRVVVDRDAEIAWGEDDGDGGDWDRWLDVQVAGIETLGRLGDADGVPAIVAALDDEMGQDIEPQAFKALAQMGQPGIDALAARLDVGSLRSRQRAAAALAQSADPAAMPIQRNLSRHLEPKIRRPAAARVMADDPSGETAKSFLDDADAGIRLDAVKRIATVHPESVMAVAADPDHAVRLAAMETIAARPAEIRAGFAGALRERLGDPAGDVAATAARALGGMTDDLTGHSLRAVATDLEKPSVVRAAAVDAAGRVEGRDGLDVLAAHIDDPDHLVRLSALLGLCEVAATDNAISAEAREILVDGLTVLPPPAEAEEPAADPPQEPEAAADTAPDDPEPDEEVASAAQQSTLASIKQANEPPPVDVSAEPTPCELDEDEARFLELAENMPRKKRPKLAPEVPLEVDRQRAVARLLAGVPGVDIVDALMKVLPDADPVLQLEAASALAAHPDLPAWFDQDRPIEPILALADAADPNLRVFAARILACAASKAADPAAFVATIDRLLDDPVPVVVREVFAVVGATDHARTRAAAALSSADTQTGAAALTWMVRTEEPGALDAAIDFALTRESWDPVKLGKILPHEAWPSAIAALSARAISAKKPLAAAAAVTAIKTLLAG